MYERSDSLKIVGYSNYTECFNTNKSISGSVFKLTCGAISYSSSKQSVIVSSTMYDEFVACYEST
jgi:hypothetical protein